jgi:antirestriction protein
VSQKGMNIMSNRKNVIAFIEKAIIQLEIDVEALNEEYIANNLSQKDYLYIQIEKLRILAHYKKLLKAAMGL